MKKCHRFVPAVVLLLAGAAWGAQVHRLPPALDQTSPALGQGLQGVLPAPAEALLDSEMVYYDDGMPAWFLTMDLDEQVAVKFTPAEVESGGECLSVLMMLYDASGPGDVELHVWSDETGMPGEDLMDPLVVHPTQYVNSGYPWNTFYNVRFNDGPGGSYALPSFWVGARWLGGAPNPLADATRDHDRSYVYDGNSWQPAIGDLMIRLWYGQDVAVELTEFLAELLPEGVQLRWHTETETDNFGFNILRSSAVAGARARLNDLIIPGHGTTALPHDYSFIDETAAPGHTYYYYLEDLDYSGQRGLSGPIAVSVPSTRFVPAPTTLVWGWPNPFRDQVEILVQNKASGGDFVESMSVPMSVMVYDARGRLTKTLMDGALPRGLHCAVWDGTDERGLAVPSGVYFCQYRAGERSASSRLVLVR